MAAKSSSRDGTTPFLIGVHTNEGPNPHDVFPDRTAENLARWMDDQRVSYHKIVDDDSVVNYVPDNRYSWSLRSGNRRSLNLCFTGYAHWSRAEWLRHPRMLQQAADVVRLWCIRYSIPMRKLTPDQVGADWAGICGHVDWTYGKKDGSHTDPGKGFPWDVFMQLVIGNAPGGIETMAFNDSFTDWAKNHQTVEGWMNTVDRRIYELHALLTPDYQSEVVVDGNRSTFKEKLSRFLMFTDAATWRTERSVAAVNERVDLVDKKLDAIIGLLEGDADPKAG